MSSVETKRWCADRYGLAYPYGLKAYGQHSFYEIAGFGAS